MRFPILDSEGTSLLLADPLLLVKNIIITHSPDGHGLKGILIDLNPTGRSCDASVHGFRTCKGSRGKHSVHTWAVRHCIVFRNSGRLDSSRFPSAYRHDRKVGIQCPRHQTRLFLSQAENMPGFYIWVPSFTATHHQTVSTSTLMSTAQRTYGDYAVGKICPLEAEQIAGPITRAALRSRSTVSAPDSCARASPKARTCPPYC
nr:hypothetical protein CFP56_16884 [Quercus suber]